MSSRAEQARGPDTAKRRRGKRSEGSAVAFRSYAQGAGVDEPLSMSRGGTTAYYSADGLGSVTSLEDGTGSVLASYTYDSYGNLTSTEPSLTNPFQYTGREWDQETNLYYYRARYYDPSIGRFINEDPTGFAGRQMDFYAYVGNSPISNFDPTGLARCKYVINGGNNGGGWFDCTPDDP